MFRNLLLIISLLLINSFVYGQRTDFKQFRLSTGLGVATSDYVSSIDQTDIFYNKLSVLPHLHFQLAYQQKETSRFSVLGQINILPKQARFEVRKNVSDGSLIREGYYHLFWSGEMELALAYHIPLKKWTIVPKVGGFVSWNVFTNTGMSYKITEVPNEGYFTHTSYGHQVSYSTRDDFSTYTGLVLGCAINKKTKRKNRTIGFFADAYLPIQNLHNDTFSYNLNTYRLYFQGRFQYINVGFRVGLTRD